MHVMLSLTIVLVVVIGLKAYLNFSKLCSSKKLRKKYMEFIEEHNTAFIREIPKAQKLFTDAGLNKKAIPVVQSLGFNKVITHAAPIADNLDIRRSDIVGGVLSLFDQLIGIYQMRLSESFSPRYWIESIVFLPTRAAKFLGGNPDRFFTKLLQLFYWILTPLLVAFRTDLYNLITSFFKGL